MMLRNTGIGQTNNNGLGSVMIDPKNDAFFWLEENLRLFREKGGFRQGLNPWGHTQDG